MPRFSGQNRGPKHARTEAGKGGANAFLLLRKQGDCPLIPVEVIEWARLWKVFNILSPFLPLLSRLSKSCEYDLSKARHRAEALIGSGFGIADAAHVAFAEQAASYFITVDDKLLRRCAHAKLPIYAMSPLEFIAQEEP